MIDLYSLRANDTIGTKVTDDTHIIQSAIDEFSDKSSSGVVRLPLGNYRITKTLVYKGNYGYGMSLIGEIAAAGPSGSVLIWDGPKGGTMLEFRGALGSSIEKIGFNGSGKANIGIALNYDNERSVGSSNVYIGRNHVGGVLDTAISIGIKPDGTHEDKQIDAIVIDQCLLVGHSKPGTTRYGINTGWGNVKNFAILNPRINGFQTGISHGGSGHMYVLGFDGGNNTYSDFVGKTANFIIETGNSEGSARLFMGSTGAHPGNVCIENFSWASALTPGDGVIVNHQGFITLRNNHFWDNKWPGAVPVIRLDTVPGTAAGLDSSGNYFANAVDWIPVVEWKGKVPDPSLVRSFGDYGGPSGKISRLKLQTPTSLQKMYARVQPLATAMAPFASNIKRFFT